MADSVFDVLSMREKTILKLISDGHSSRTAADLLNLQMTTVDRHRANILKKLNIHSKQEMLQLVEQHNFKDYFNPPPS